MERADTTLVLAAILFLYFLPSVIAYWRGHREVVTIAFLNVLVGWTALGWAVLFLCAFSRNVEPA
jgi:hypothetical protein